MTNLYLAPTAGLCLALASLLVGCTTTPLNPEQNQQLDQAVANRDPAQLTGRMRYLYEQRVRTAEVDEALSTGESENLRGRQKSRYEEEVDYARIEEEKAQAEAAALAESERLAAEERARQVKLDKELAALKAAEKRELAKQRKIAEAKALQQKIKEPVHDDWLDDMRALTSHFKTNGFEPATRLVDVYARTMQYLLHVNPTEEQFSSFYSKFSDTEKLDHRRMFHNKTGTELIAQFWDERDTDKATN